MKDIIALENRIVRTYVPKVCVQYSLSKITKATPNVFTSYKVTKVGPDEWDAAHLNELHNLFYCGAQSKDMLLYMAAVSRKVHWRQFVLSMAVVATTIAAIIIGIITILNIIKK